MIERRRIAVLTTGRQDWGILRTVCSALKEHPAFDLVLVAGGMACSPRFGRVVDLIGEDGFEVAAELPWTEDAQGTPRSALEQAGDATARVGEALTRLDVDALVLVGDRFETLSAALAATLVGIPIVHLHGGEQTEGAMDDAIRHAVTKLAHLHLVSHPEHRDRVLALGEDPGSVHVVGAPGLDNLGRADLPSRAELEAKLGIALEPPLVLVTVHPTTLAAQKDEDARAVAAAMERVPATYVITLPNADPGNEQVRAHMQGVISRVRGVAAEALGERNYWGLLRLADALLGNSSSALIEAPALFLPAVNVGDRQKGRRREANVIDVATDPDAIVAALGRALGSSFRDSLRTAGAETTAPGSIGKKAVEILAATHFGRPARKKPVNLGNKNGP
ncbi:UDP-N-acetylglucosamine 2-epimerase [Pendulispora rubella]|uniref:UDP-N-acetylglucosamine 2-epimerase n=1 Tax=Pendulispora rubella TaxID=2741070 RepID=A0ABZ2LBW0_9BACT